MKSLQNISYKTLFTILFLSLAGIVFFIRIGGNTQKVSAAWWDEMWHYRKAISIENNSGTNLIDFQVSVSIGTSQLIADGKMQTDCDDIRVTDINGNLLPHWIEENNPGCNQLTDTKIWLKANSLPISGATVYIYYGNQQADNSENGDNVFELFDDFSNGLNNWSIFNGIHYGGTLVATINNGQLILTGTNAEGGIYKNNFATADGIVEFMARADQLRNGNDMGAIARRQSNTQYYDMGVNWGNNTTTRIAKDAGHTNLASTSYTYGSGVFRLISGHFSGSSLKTYIDNNFKIGVTDTTYSSAGNVGIAMDAGHESGGLSVQWTIDNFRVRKYASTEPVPSPQSEESSTGPIAYWKFDEGTGATTFDSTSYQNNGNITGATWQNEDQCISGKCLNFDSAQNQYVLSNNTIPFTGSQTYSVWVYPKSTEWLMGILTTHSHANNSNIGINISTNKFSISIGYTDETREYQDRQSNFIIPINTWSHVELVYNNIDNSVTFYVNGKFDKQWVLAKTVKFVNDKILVGQWSNSYLGGYKFNGYIDEPKIYPYARTADQIKQDYNSRGSLSGAGVNLGVRSNTAPSLKSSLIAHYKFDEGSGTTTNDSSENKNNLTFGVGNSSPVWSTNSKTNKALSFNGLTTYIENNSNNDVFNLVNNLTVSAWVNPSSFSGSSKYIFGHYYQYGIYLTSSGTYEAILRGNDGTYYYPTSSKTLNLNEWQYLTLSFNEGEASLFINGKFINSSTIPTTTLYNISTDLITIGSYFNGSRSNNFNGLIDEVKIYNRALTADEIKQDYNQGSAISFGQTTQNIGGTTTSLNYCIPGDTSYCASPVAEWNFEENTGTTVKDTSGNNLNGSLDGNPTWGSQCHKGSCLTLDHIDNRMTVNHSSILEPTSITIGGWVKLNNINDRHVLFTKWNGYSIEINSSGYPYFRTYNGSQQDLNSNKNIVWGKWHYISATFDDTTKQKNIYLDGINVGTTTVTNSIAYSQGVFAIPYNSGLMASGLVDDVRIYNYARTPAQIAYDYNRGAPIGWWKLDECQGSTAFDSSGIGNTGVISIGQSGTQTTLGTCQTGTSAAWTNGSVGKINSSLNFDGVDDYFRINQPSIQTFPNYFSISGWIYPENQTGYIVTPQSNGRDQMLAYDSSGQRIRITVAESADTNQRTRYSKTNSVPLNKWTHFSVSINDKKIMMYINGNLDSEYNETINIAEWNSSWYFGQRGVETSWYKGKIDDLRIYNYALTSEQVKQAYNGGAVNFN